MTKRIALAINDQLIERMNIAGAKDYSRLGDFVRNLILTGLEARERRIAHLKVLKRQAEGLQVYSSGLESALKLR
jgi:hypothetical protein